MMNATFIRRAVGFVLALAWVANGRVAQAGPLVNGSVNQTGTSIDNHPLDATATFSLDGSNHLIVTLTNNLANELVVSVSQNISGIGFALYNGDAAVAMAGNTSELGSGTITNFNKSTTPTPAGSTSNAGWVNDGSGSTFHLTVIGTPTAPTMTIIGGDGSSKYPNAVPSITGNSHSPQLYGTVTFDLGVIAGVFNSTQVEDV